MKIGILGTAFSYRKAPFDDPSWEFWACNNGEPPRWDRWFQLHGGAIIDSFPGYRDWLAAQIKPVYMQTTCASVPNATAYPLDAMKAKYGDWFFTSTISFMLALAIEEGAEEIGLWGVDLAHASEYAYQKPGARFFLQIARMQGIKVTMPPECEVAAPGRLYGYEPDSWIKTKSAARMEELMARVAENDGRRQAVWLEKAMLRGRELNLTPEQAGARLAELTAQEAEIERTALLLDGAVQNMQHIALNWVGE